MEILKLKIDEIKWDKNYYYLISDKKDYKFKIIDGTVDIKIYTNENDKVGIEYLEKGDLIKLHFDKKANLGKKIYINTKFILNSDSEELEVY